MGRKIIQRLTAYGNVKTECQGIENLPAEGGYVMYPNHQGKFDVLGIMDCVEAPCTFVMDRNKSYQLLLSELVDLLNAKRMSITDVRDGMRVMNKITEELKEGRRYIIFPEGGYLVRNRNKVKDFKAGSFKCAMKAGVPIVPVVLIDSYKVFNAMTWRPVTVKVIFLPPITYEEYKDMKTVDLAAEVRGRIIDAMLAQNIDPEA